MDITTIIEKLMAANKAHYYSKGLRGEFSIEHDSHLLTPSELETWICVLHMGTSNHSERCEDLHTWKVEFE